MRLSKSWIIASKDFKIFRKKKNVIYSLVAVPFIISVLLPTVVEYAGNRKGGNGFPAAEIVVLLPAFIFFYVILSAYIPTPIASYTLVGEKLEKSLEPLLATPTTDSEILLGKGIAAFLPAIATIVGGATVFMVLMDLVTRGRLGYYFFPNWDAAIVLFLIVPLAVIISVEWNVIVSARVSDVRIAQQLGILLVLPFAGIYVGGELGVVPLGNASDLLIVAGILLVVAVLFLFVARGTFRREEILTKWK